MSTTHIVIIGSLLIGGLVLTLMLTPLSIRLAHRWGVIDTPGGRKVHQTPTPRFGGAAIFAAIALVSLVAIPASDVLIGSFAMRWPFFVSVATGATLIFAVGIYDDVRNAPIALRFGTEFLAASIVVFGGGVQIQTIGLPFAGLVELGALSIPLTLFWIVGVTNALNIIDGLDGLAGGISLIACIIVFVVAAVSQQFLPMAALALLIGCILGFLRYNAHPARIFLGDSGALLLGFLLAVIAVDCSLKRSTGLALLIALQILALPVLDTLYSMSRRMVADVRKRGRFSSDAIKAMFVADRQHIHHRLLDSGHSQVRTVWILYMLSFSLGGLGLLSALVLDDLIAALSLLVGFILFMTTRHVIASTPETATNKRST